MGTIHQPTPSNTKISNDNQTDPATPNHQTPDTQREKFGQPK
jgi:hypothetical protein